MYEFSAHTKTLQARGISPLEGELLRPVEGTELKIGDTVVSSVREFVAELVQAVPDHEGSVVAARTDLNGQARYICIKRRLLRIAPIAFVEGKPVYPGDKLWWAETPVTALAFKWFAGQDGNAFLEVETQYSTNTHVSTIDLTWEKPAPPVRDEIRYILVDLNGRTSSQAYCTPSEVHAAFPAKVVNNGTIVRISVPVRQGALG